MPTYHKGVTRAAIRDGFSMYNGISRPASTIGNGFIRDKKGDISEFENDRQTSNIVTGTALENHFIMDTDASGIAIEHNHTNVGSKSPRKWQQMVSTSTTQADTMEEDRKYGFRIHTVTHSLGRHSYTKIKCFSYEYI
jgi:hypothetical protein